MQAAEVSPVVGLWVCLRETGEPAPLPGLGAAPCAPQTSAPALTFTEVGGRHGGPCQCFHSCKKTFPLESLKIGVTLPRGVIQAEPTSRSS